MQRGILTAGLAVFSLLLMQTSAEARAPIVADPGDFIISDLESDDGGTSGANVFVYPDAFDLDEIVFDDNESTSDIKWSYTVTGGNIRLNDADPLGAGDPVDPPAENRIDLSDDPDSLDADMSTVTLRNDDLSPTGTLPNAANEPGEDGIIAGQTATVTLFASDCTTFSQTSMIVYTFNANPATPITLLPDRRAPDDLMNVLELEFKNTANGWTARQFAGNNSLGGTTSVDPELGLCMTVDNAGDNGVEWRSPTNLIDLTQRQIYRVRLFMLTDQTAVASIPVWDFNYLNVQGPGDSFPGFLNYGGRRFVVDTEGGANGIGRANGRGYFEFWFAPAAVDTPQWNSLPNNAFTPAASVNTGMRFIVRVLDFDESLQASTRSGSIYVGKIVVDRFPLEELDANASVIYNEPISDAMYRAFRPSTAVDPLATATFDEVGNTLTISLPSAAQATVDPVRATLGPEDASLAAFITDPNTGATVRNPLRLYPAQWETDTLYRGRVAIQAANAGGAGGIAPGSNPIDIIDVTHDTYTLELGGSDFVTSGDAGLGEAGMPGAGTPVGALSSLQGIVPAVVPQWHTYFYGNNATDSLIQNVDRWRMQVDFFNRADIGIAEPKNETGTDDFAIWSYELDEINFDPDL